MIHILAVSNNKNGGTVIPATKNMATPLLVRNTHQNIEIKETVVGGKAEYWKKVFTDKNAGSPLSSEITEGEYNELKAEAERQDRVYEETGSFSPGM